MGAYLSEPVTDKFSMDSRASGLSYGASSMQGWRASQEDAHNCIPDFDTETLLFSVYDGHGGAEVAQYCAMKLPDFIKSTEAYKAGNLAQALEDAFLEFDETLIKEETLSHLKHMAGIADHHSDTEENEVDHLYEEARMPLEELLAKYRSGSSNPNLRHLSNDKPISPFLRAKGIQSEEGPSSSGSSSSSHTKLPFQVDKDVKAENSCNDEQIKENCPSKAKDEVKAGQPMLNGELSDKENTKEKPKSTLEESGDGFHQRIKKEGEECCKNGEDPKEEDEDLASEGAENTSPTKGKGKGKKSSKAVEAEEAPGTTNAETSSSEPKSAQKRKHRNAKPVVMEDGSGGSDSDESDEEYEESQSDHEEEADESKAKLEDEDEEEEEEEDEEEDEDDDEEEEEEEEEEEDTFQFSEKDEPGFDSGCTAVVALLKKNELYVANAGDSRCVVCRNGKAIEMSHDHKPEDDIEMRRIVNAGGKVTSDGRVNGGLNLSRAIGDHSYKKNKNLPNRDQMISALPDIRTLTIDPNEDEFMVIACDGIWNFMNSQEVVDYIREKLAEGREKLSSICEELFDHCLAPTTVGDGTGCDNMTAIIVKFERPEEARTESQKRTSPEADTNDSLNTKKQKVDDSND